jgi:flagellar hook protein FlgE
MQAHSKGIKTVGNNLANVNTPGFKGAQLEFANLFQQGTNPQQGQGNVFSTGQGQGVVTAGSSINFSAGGDLATGNPLNAKIDGNGFFAVRRGTDILYTRDGNFGLNPAGMLVNASGDHVLGLGTDGQLTEVSVPTLMHDKPKATSVVKFAGNLSSVVAAPPVDTKVDNVTVYDASGVAHPLSLSFKNNGSGAFDVTIKDATATTIGTGTIKFIVGGPIAGFDSIKFSLPPGGNPMTLDFSSDVVSLSGASSIAFASQDGYTGGVQIAQAIDAAGYLTVQYSNGQTEKGPRLALADFASEHNLQDAGGSMFRTIGDATPTFAHAGELGLGMLASGHREGSNVDLSQAFSDLILMQRGYQAGSHVVSVANDLIQELFDMKGHR